MPTLAFIIFLGWLFSQVFESPLEKIVSSPQSMKIASKAMALLSRHIFLLYRLRAERSLSVNLLKMA